MEISFHKITETLNVLVNNGSSIGSHTLDLIAPPKLTSEITQLPPLNQKGFSRDLRGGKVKQICVLVAEDDYVSNIHSAMFFAEDKEFSVAHQRTKVSLMRRLGLSDIRPKRGNRLKKILSTMI